MAPPFDLDLPGGWSVRSTVRRTGVRVNLVDPAGMPLAGLTSALGSVLTIERAWRGLVQDGRLQWWAIAFGRAADDAPLTVTFAGPRLSNASGYRRPVPHRIVRRPTVAHGLWVAAVPGLQLVVTAHQGSREHVRHIAPLPGRWPSVVTRVEGAAG